MPDIFIRHVTLLDFYLIDRYDGASYDLSNFTFDDVYHLAGVDLGVICTGSGGIVVSRSQRMKLYNLASDLRLSSVFCRMLWYNIESLPLG